MFTDQMQSNLGFVTSQTAYIETGVYKHRFASIRYPGLIPVDYSANPWARTVDYYSMNSAGQAQWVADRAKDLKFVGTEYGKSTTTVHMANIGYDFGIEEVHQAAMLGQNLQGDKALAARMAYEHMVDRVAFEGDAEKGFQGLYNNTGVTAISATTGDWATATEAQILADVNELLTGIFTATNEIAMADTLILPSAKRQYIGSTQLGDTQITILEFLQKNNSFTAETGRPLTIISSRGLDAAGAGGTSRMVAYRRSPEVLKMHIPMQHEFLPVQIKGLSYEIPGIFRLGGLDIRLTEEVRYSDGI